MKRALFLLVVILFLLPIQSVSADVVSADSEFADVLILHSYHQQYPWTSDMQNGLESCLNIENLEYYVEFLDEYRFNSDHTYNNMFLLLKEKYADIQFECIVVTDNYAFNFLDMYYDTLFPSVPVVFTGFNNLKPDMLFTENITGLVQTVDHKEIIQTILNLHPDISQLIVAGPQSLTAQMEHSLFEDVLEELNLDIPTNNIQVNYRHELIDILKTQDENTVVIITTKITDEDEKAVLVPESISEVIDATGLPIYVTLRPMLSEDNEGAVGGLVVDSYIHGQIAADMVNQIIEGARPQDIPIQWEPINTYTFNYFRLQQFDIDERNLPSDSIILGTPESGITIERSSLFLYIGITSSLALFVILLIIQIRIRQRTEIELKKNKEKLEKTNATLIKKNQEIDFLARKDPLTDFYNRKHLVALIDEILKRGEKIAIYAIHIRNIKTLDDAYGYETGDIARHKISRLIVTQYNNEQQIFGRYYDIYYIVDYRIDAAFHIESAIGAIRQTLSTSIKAMEYTLEPQVKVGVAVSDMHDQGNVLLHKVDITLLSALENVKSFYKVYNKSLRTRIEERFALENDIKRALKDNEFELYYQPIIDIVQNRIVSCEALIRWKNRHGDFVSPAVFIPIAEEMGLIGKIGKWVIDEACRTLSSCFSDFDITMSINVSAKQIDARLESVFREALERHQIDPSKLNIEITETAVMDDTENNIQVLHKIHDMGIGIALDDFGVGHSSLKYVIDLPIDKMKIDKSFVKNIVDADQMALVRAMFGLGNMFHYQVVAEGVETPKQKEILENIGVTEIQGWYFSKALSKNAFQAYYRENNQPNRIE